MATQASVLEVETVKQAAVVERPAKSERLLAYDVLRVVAALAVVVVHTSAGETMRLDLRGTANGGAAWLLAVGLDAAARWCVPIYLMLSGAFLLPYRQRGMATGVFLRKRMLRVAVPFALWSALYLVWEVFVARPAWMGWPGWAGVPRLLWAHLVTAPAMYHLWYFYCLLGLYLLTPALSVLVAHGSRRLLWATTALLFSAAPFALVVPFLPLAPGGAVLLAAATASNGPGALYASRYLPLAQDAVYVGYFLLGYLLVSAARRPPAWLRALLYLSGVLGAAAMVVSTLALTPSSIHTIAVPSTPLMAYPSLATLAEALAVFVACQSVRWERVALFRWGWGRAALSEAALATYGVYLVHILVKYYVEQWAGLVQPLTSLRYELLAPLIIFALSLAIVLPLRRLPLLRWLLP